MLPPGAHYLPDFVSSAEERVLVQALDCGAWDVAMRRRVQHFGYRYDYRSRRVESAAFLGPLPNWLSRISDSLVRKGFFEDLPDQVIANEYFPGQGISAHVDCVPCFSGTIASLSLLSRLRNGIPQQSNRRGCVDDAGTPFAASPDRCRSL